MKSFFCRFIYHILTEFNFLYLVGIWISFSLQDRIKYSQTGGKYFLSPVISPHSSNHVYLSWQFNGLHQASDPWIGSNPPDIRLRRLLKIQSINGAFWVSILGQLQPFQLVFHLLLQASSWEFSTKSNMQSYFKKHPSSHFWLTLVLTNVTPCYSFNGLSIWYFPIQYIVK